MGGFQHQRRRLIAAIGLAGLASLGVAAAAAAFLASQALVLQVVGAVGAFAGSLLLASVLVAAVARAYTCPSCRQMPLRVKVRAETVFTRSLRKLQRLGRRARYPSASVLFVDLNPTNCPSCGAFLRTHIGRPDSASHA